MNPEGPGHENGLSCCKSVANRRFLFVIILAAVCPLLAGCPHNDYTVELKPITNGVERTLIFYRAEGDSNGAPSRQAFPSNELAAITEAYPPNAVKQEGQRCVATGDFDGTLPNDIGGFGSFTNFPSNLGDAGFYMERFRGNDDFAAQIDQQFQAADQIADLVIGWSKTEFRHEPGYKKLRQFLDKDFRNDLKNAGLYFWTLRLNNPSDTNAPEEFTARFCQYLLERGYLKISDASEINSILNGNDDTAMLYLFRRLAAEKLGVPTSGTSAKPLAVLDDSVAFEQSWNKYLARTDLYRAKLKEWQQQRIKNPQLKVPEPQSVMDDLFGSLLPFGLGEETDHLTVQLMLPEAPNHTNGKWQNGQVTWDTDLDPERALPVLCYASWSRPDTNFQTGHFGAVLLNGNNLAQYCLWRSTLTDDQAQEWESFVAGLQPGPDLRKQLRAFQFNTTAPMMTTNELNRLETGANLLLAALPKDTGATAPGSK